ncbi:GyrI-like domain-containing protein [Agaribacter flavus]|uniref:GyrI-like domain-containing protein n=1 Tax=Agaribacter flavus TaxID=1902781 RepID=A0ABV7FNP8_9ALTE
MSIYHKRDVVKGEAIYTAALAVGKQPDNLPNEFVFDHVPKVLVYQITHTGDYQHLGNVWTTLYTMERNKEIKCNKSVKPFEVYENSPEQVSKAQLLTTVCFPVI